MPLRSLWLDGRGAAVKALTPAAAQFERLTKACRAVDAAITHCYKVGNDADYVKACAALSILEELRASARLVIVAADV